MHVSLDNISFYSHAPAKPSLRALPDSCWRAYNPSVAPQAPQTLPNAPPSRQNLHGTSLSTAGLCLTPSRESRINVRKNLDVSAGNEFDIEIGRAMVQNSQAMHETGLNMHFDSVLRKECYSDTPQSARPSLDIDYLEELPSENPLGSLDPDLVQAEPQWHHPSPPVSPADWPSRDQDSISSEEARDQRSAPPEVSLSCARDLLSPLPDLPLPPSLGTIMQDVSEVNKAHFGTESNEDPAGALQDRVTTIQSAEVDEPSISQTISDQNTRGKSTESFCSHLSCLELEPRGAKKSPTKLASKPCLRPRRIAKPTRSKEFPSVSVIIPARRSDESSTRAKNRPSTRLRNCSYSGDSEPDSSNLMSESSTDSDGSSLKSKGRVRRRLKRARGKALDPRKESVSESTSQSQQTPGVGFGVASDTSQEIFGRAVLRIQAHGPRHAYFMTFLPEVSHSPSAPSPSEIPPKHSSRPEAFSKTTSTRRIGRNKRHQGGVITACEDGAGRSTKLPRRSSFGEDRSIESLSEDDKKLINLKEREGLSWKAITKHFPGRSQGSLQVRYCTRLKRYGGVKIPCVGVST